MPGSIASSGQYQWKNDLHKTKYGMLPFTVDLTNVIHGHNQTFRRKGLCSRISILSRKVSAMSNWRRCGLLFHKGYTPSEVGSMLIRINNKCCKPPLGDQEILSIFRSIAKREGK